MCLCNDNLQIQYFLVRRATQSIQYDLLLRSKVRLQILIPQEIPVVGISVSYGCTINGYLGIWRNAKKLYEIVNNCSFRRINFSSQQELHSTLYSTGSLFQCSTVPVFRKIMKAEFFFVIIIIYYYVHN